MGAVIEFVDSQSPERGDARPSSIALASHAASRVLARADRRLADVDLLVNVGVYRDGHICEPAMAPLIEQAVRERDAAPAGAGLFSFDLANGAGGLLNAFHTADALIATRGLRSALLVASDVDPSPGRTTGWSLDARGAAVLVGPGAPDRGFEAFHFETFVKHSDLLESRLHWEPSQPDGQRFSIQTGDEFLERSVDCASKSIARFLFQQRLIESDIDLIVAAHFPEGFPERLGERLGFGRDRIARGTGCSYTAGPAMGLAVALGDGRFETARRVLFVAVGAGVSVGLALYRAAGSTRPD